MPTVIRFDRRDGGTGTVLDTTYLGKDDTITGTAQEKAQIPMGFSMTAADRLTKISVEGMYFDADLNMTTDQRQARLNAAKWVEDIRAACVFTPPTYRELPRGKALMVNVANNFGDVVADKITPSGHDLVLLSNCCLLAAEVTDDVGVAGIKCLFTFGRVATVAAP